MIPAGRGGVGKGVINVMLLIKLIIPFMIQLLGVVSRVFVGVIYM